MALCKRRFFVQSEGGMRMKVDHREEGLLRGIYFI